MSERLFAFERHRLSVSAYGKLQRCAAGYILSTHYCAADDMVSFALANGIKVHAEFESCHVIHGYEVIEHEKKIEIEGQATRNWMGYIDAVCKDPDGEIFVVDIKTSKRTPCASWAREYLTSLQAALYTVAMDVETFAIYHPDGKMYMTQLNKAVSRHRLRKAFDEFMSWQSAGQKFTCKPSWSCRFCEFDGHCEHLMHNPGCTLPPTLQIKKSTR